MKSKQNLIRNYLLKEEADKVQKDYVDPTEIPPNSNDNPDPETP